MNKVTIYKKFISIIFIVNLFFISGCSSGGQQAYMDYTPIYQAEDEFTKGFYENVSIEIEKVQIDSSMGTVTVKMPDLTGIYEAHYDEFISGQTEEDIQKILLQNMDECIMEISIDTELIQDGVICRLKSTEQIDKIISDKVDNFLNSVLSDMQINISIELYLEGIQ